MLEIPKQGCCLAFDFGKARIGVAQGESSLHIAHPICTVSGASNDEKFARIAQLIKEWQPEYLVVGLPTHINGTEHEMTRLARQFGAGCTGGSANLFIGWTNASRPYMPKNCCARPQCSVKNKSPCSTKWRHRRFCIIFLITALRNISTGVKQPALLLMFNSTVCSRRCRLLRTVF